MNLLLDCLKTENIDLFYIDLFCGAGGTSSGIEIADINGKKVGKVIACVNHDKNAIASHMANHPDALHFTEDIRVLNISPIISLVSKIRVINPSAKIVLWASLECTNFSNVGSSIDDPSQTITANRKWHYLMNPQFMSAGGSIENPCFTLIARMDKMPPYLVATQQGFGIEIYETDSQMTRKIKEFMSMYGIADIKMRMLRIPELKQIMGFPKDYVLIGTQADQKKFIGNAVEVTMAKVLCESLAKSLVYNKCLTA